MKKKLAALIAGALMISGALFVTGCSNASASSGSSSSPTGQISVYSREEGSGTRGAFVELFGIEEKDPGGNKVDKTTASAVVTNSTSVMMTSVAGDKAGIGYISLGSLNATVKAAKIDGAEATVENVKNGSYKISRPFNIATKADVSPAAKDFISYIMSPEGQKVVEGNHYISLGASASPYTASGASGKVVVAGSSSVTPVMEKLAEAYKELNPNVTIEVQQSDSTTGMNMALAGTCDIGMASRALKDSEVSGGLTPTVIAQDGIAVIIAPGTTLDSLTSSQVKAVYTGSATKWEDALAQK